MNDAGANSIARVRETLLLHRGQLTETEAAQLAGVSTSRFRHAFKHLAHVSFRTARLQAKLAHGAELLKNSTLSVNEISGLLGYSDRTKFEKAFKKINGLTPTVYRRLHL
jgi:AraC-like DNA-binding protein